MSAPLRRGVALLAAVFLLCVAPSRAASQEQGDSFGMTAMAHAAIEKGLAYLAATQRQDGSWPGRHGDTPAIIASGAVAFMGAGHVPGRGRYGPNVARALRHITSNALPNVQLYNRGRHIMYHQGLATLALAEAWGMTQDEEIRGVLRRAIDLIVATQNRDGGWHYWPEVRRSADVSVTVMQLMALRAAYEAGIYVPQETIERGIRYVQDCHSPVERGGDGGFTYTPSRDESGYARTGAGVLSLQVSGLYRAKEVNQGIDYLLKHDFKPGDSKQYYYGIYYSAMAMYQIQSLGEWGRQAWRRWYPQQIQRLVEVQREEGNWRGHYGDYTSAMALLVLEIPYRYLPIYQR